MEFLSARRGPLLLIALYVGGFLGFITQETSAWLGANARQQSARAELALLRLHAANAPSAPSRRARVFRAESETQAIAAFDALAGRTIASSGGVVISSRSEEGKPSRQRTITISTVFEGDIKVVQSALYKLESGSPMIFIDKISIAPQNGRISSNDPVLRVSMSLSSRWSAKR